MRALCIAVLIASSAHADTRVVIVETRGAPSLPTLSSQVSLHASANVDVQRAPDADPLTFGERASQIVEGGAALVVWMAPVDGGYLVFVAGRAANRAVTELVRVDVAIGVQEIERTIALKIAGLLDAVQSPEPIAAIIDVPVRVRDEWRVEIGGYVAYETHERASDGRAALAVGRTFHAGAWRLVPWVGGYWQASGTIERAAGRASIVELGGTLAAEGGREVGPVELFGRPRLVAAGIQTRGVSDDGRRGRATVFAPYAGLEVGAQRVVSRNVRFGIAAGCDFALIHRELVIDGETIVDLGALRLHVGALLTVSL